MSADDVRAQAKAQCGGREFCKIAGWTSAAEAATGFPMTDRELAAQAFSYDVNRASGYEDTRWDCKRWPRADKNECL